jgi:cobalamin biosynthesis protein CbiG
MWEKRSGLQKSSWKKSQNFTAKILDMNSEISNQDMNTEYTTVIFYITGNGLSVARSVKELFPDALIFRFKSEIFRKQWGSAKNIICIMATGIVVRAVAPLLKDKRTDPAVVVLDENGEFVISLLSGHLGGANAITRGIADCIGAHAVITTASDVQGKIALDLWAAEENLYVEDYKKLKALSAKIVNGKRINVRTEHIFNSDHIPKEFDMVGRNDDADIIISSRLMDNSALFLRPKNLFIGVGCNRDTTKEEIQDMVSKTLEREKLSINSVARVATIDLKEDEQGLLDFAREKGLGIDFFTKNDLNGAILRHNIASSDTVKAATGAAAVSEPAAILAARKRFHNSTLVIPKEKRGNVTLAIAKAEFIL